MYTLEIVLTVTLLVSTWINYTLFSKLSLINDNFDDVLGSIEVFKEHLEQLNQTEIYMGEPTIEKFIDHSREVVEDIDSFMSKFSEEEQNA
jgi:hypothetical protein